MQEVLQLANPQASGDPLLRGHRLPVLLAGKLQPLGREVPVPLEVLLGWWWQSSGESLATKVQPVLNEEAREGVRAIGHILRHAQRGACHVLS